MTVALITVPFIRQDTSALPESKQVSRPSWSTQPAPWLDQITESLPGSPPLPATLIWTTWPGLAKAGAWME